MCTRMRREKILLIPILEDYVPYDIALIIQSYGAVDKIRIHRNCLRHSDKLTEECRHSVWINGSKPTQQNKLTVYISQLHRFLKDNRNVTPFGSQIGWVLEHIRTSFYFHQGTLDPSWLESIQFINIDCFCLESYPCRHEIQAVLFSGAKEPTNLPRMANADLLLAIVSKIPERVNVPTADNLRIGWQVDDVRRHLLCDF